MAGMKDIKQALTDRAFVRANARLIQEQGCFIATIAINGSDRITTQEKEDRGLVFDAIKKANLCTNDQISYSGREVIVELTERDQAAALFNFLFLKKTTFDKANVESKLGTAIETHAARIPGPRVDNSSEIILSRAERDLLNGDIEFDPTLGF